MVPRVWETGEETPPIAKRITNESWSQCHDVVVSSAELSCPSYTNFVVFKAR